MRGVCEAGNDFRVKDAEDERGHGDDETNERSRGSDVKESAARANRRANHDERTECSDERWKGNEVRIGRVDVVMTAGEVMAKLMYEQDRE